MMKDLSSQLYLQQLVNHPGNMMAEVFIFLISYLKEREIWLVEIMKEEKEVCFHIFSFFS